MKKNTLIISGICIAVLLAAAACAQPFSKDITVVFRYDDLSEISDSALESDLISAFQDHGMAFTAAVIPFVFTGDQGSPALDQVNAENAPMGPQKMELLNSAVQSGVVEAVMHGYSHQTIPEEGGHREFQGLDLEQQVHKISTGVDFLREQVGIPITTFVPPWNRYDADTVRVLEQHAFSVMSADQDGLPIPDSPLLFLPSTCELNEVREAVVAARNSLDPRPVVVVLFHQFDILGNEVNFPLLDFTEFIALLDWLEDQPDVHVRTLQQALEHLPGLNARRYAHNFAIRNSKMIPPMLSGLVEPRVYQSPYPILALIALFYLNVASITALAAYLVGKPLFRWSALLMWLARIASLIALFFIARYAFRGSKVGFRGATGVAIFAGAALGVWWASLKKGHKPKKPPAKPA